VGVSGPGVKAAAVVGIGVEEGADTVRGVVVGGFGEDRASGWLEQAAAARVMSMSISASAEGRMVRLQAMLHQVKGGPHKGRTSAGV